MEKFDIIATLKIFEVLLLIFNVKAEILLHIENSSIKNM